MKRSNGLARRPPATIKISSFTKSEPGIVKHCALAWPEMAPWFCTLEASPPVVYNGKLIEGKAVYAGNRLGLLNV
jgi:hypothetical protein